MLMLLFVQIVFVMLVAGSFVGMIAEAEKNKGLSQQLAAVCIAAILALIATFYAG